MEIDPIFQGAGVKAGLEIWCIENLRLVPVPKSSYGKFFSGSAYLILNTVLLKSSSPQHDIHYWLGNDAREVDSALASDKALELDAALGSQAVQFREVQGLETEKFLSYFKPCIIPIEGVFSSGRGELNCETYQISLFTCKGDHVVHVKEVPFSRSSLNHNDVFILDTASKIFLFSGCNSSIQERAKALEVVQYIKENKHNGKCEVATIEDGKFVGDPDVGEFWGLFGGYAPIPRDLPPSLQKQPDIPNAKLFWITTQGKLCQTLCDTLNKEMLESNKCYMLDCDNEIFVWMGRNTSITERKTSISAAEDFLKSQGWSTRSHLTFLTEGSETAIFRSYFDVWPQLAEPRLYEEGRGKVAAMFKQQGYDVKELPEDDCVSFIDCSGILKVWRVNDDELFLVPVAEQTKLFSGDCYIVQYKYAGNRRDEYIFYAWLGCGAVLEDRVDAISQMNTIVDSMKGDSVLAQVIEGKEPIEFFLIFQTLIVFKGGLSTRYKRFIAEKGIADETYDEKKTALFRVQGTSPNNMQAIQVDQVSSSLNSSYCFILQTETSIFTWVGNLSSTRDHDLLDRMLDLINPTLQPISVREGSEPDVFWKALGGKAEHPREKEIKAYVEDPHLFTCTLTDGDLKMKEIFNFTQDDLTTEDVLILDCYRDIYVWCGCHSNVRSKKQALEIGFAFVKTDKYPHVYNVRPTDAFSTPMFDSVYFKDEPFHEYALNSAVQLLQIKFLEIDILGEGLSLETPIYVVTEGHEPPFFTRFFEWDSSKANMHGNSFERKLAILKGTVQKIEVPLRNSWKAYSTENTPDSLRSRSVSSNGLRRSSSSASSVSGSNLKSSDNHQISSVSPIARSLFSGSYPDHDSADGSSVAPGPPAVVPNSPSENVGLGQIDGVKVDVNLLIYPYERLKVVADDPVTTGIDVTKREAYLSEEEFQQIFGMTKTAFYKLPKWRQNNLKRSVHLF